MEPSHLVVAYSCREFEHSRLAWQATTWPVRRPPEMAYVKMTGDGDGKIDANGVLRLAVADGYYDLIDKTQALFEWFLQERSEPWLVKCDDDVWLSPIALKRIIENKHHYAGAYGQHYAGGPLYVLHRNLIAKLAPLRNYVEGDELAEDVAVGAAVRDCGESPQLLGFDQILWYLPSRAYA